MSEYDLFKGLSELDEDLLMQPRKFVSLRMNIMFCFIAANISVLIPRNKPALSIVLFLISFGAMYAFATWLMNRKKNRKLLIETEEDTVE